LTGDSSDAERSTSKLLKNSVCRLLKKISEARRAKSIGLRGRLEAYWFGTLSEAIERTLRQSSGQSAKAYELFQQRARSFPVIVNLIGVPISKVWV
jgi:hypothetical protein